MPIETHTCIVVLCDRDGAEWYEESESSGAPWHFENLAQARKALVDRYEPDRRWQIEDGKPILCSICVRREECERNGHQWSEWRDTHLMDGAVKDRDCEHCLKYENNVGQLVEQMTGEGGGDD